jgi:chaperonin GroES
MQLSIDQKDLNKLLMVGDKVLIKPKNPQSQTKTGLYLPPSVQQGEKIQSGYISKPDRDIRYRLPPKSMKSGKRKRKKGYNTFPCRQKREIWPSTFRTLPTKSFSTTKPI